MTLIKKKSLKFAILLIVVALNLGCDQISKVIARKNIEPYEQITIIKDRFILTKVENTGAFLSAGSNLPDFVKVALLTVMPMAVLIYGLWFLFKNKQLSPQMQIGISFLIGGGIGNIYDRIVHGAVTDFLFMDFVLFRTGIFNMADVSIMIGMGLLLLDAILNTKTSKPEEVN